MLQRTNATTNSFYQQNQDATTNEYYNEQLLSIKIRMLQRTRRNISYYIKFYCSFHKGKTVYAFMFVRLICFSNLHVQCIKFK